MQSASQTSDRSAPVFSLRVSSPHRLRIPIILTAQKESSNVIEKIMLHDSADFLLKIVLFNNCPVFVVMIFFVFPLHVSKSR